jgi:hypothetical protein
MMVTVYTPVHLLSAEMITNKVLLLTAAHWVQSHVMSYGICGGQSDIEAGFLKVLRFHRSAIR